MRILVLMVVVLFSGMVSWSSAQEFAVQQLDASPRHHEWVEIPSVNGRNVHAFVVYPENKTNGPAVIAIHENRGLTDWVRSFADQLAAKGYLVIAPDLLSGFDAQHDRTSDFSTSDEAKAAIYELTQEQVTADLKAVQDYIAHVPSANGKTAVVGFCWGGKQSFQFAVDAENLSAALVFYGSPPEAEVMSAINAPVYGFYGENDQRINATIPDTENLMKDKGKIYAPEIYSGAGHAFMRYGDDPEGSAENRAARDAAWERLEKLLGDM